LFDGKEPKTISIPDMGTIWELGYAFALKKIKPVTTIGYYTSPVPKVNLMIAQSLDGIAENIEDVFVSGGQYVNLSALTAYNGEQI
jgi:nucleoside 2-deoxyribosyltransferase